MVPTTITVYIWHCIQAKDIHFAHEDEANLVSALTTLGVIYGMFATVTMVLVSDKWPKTTEAVLKRDESAFLMIRDERLSITFNMITGILAFMVLFIMGGIDYHNYWSGFVSMSSVSLVMCLVYVGVRDLQDITKSLWVRERVPSEWLTKSVDKHFFNDK